MSNFLASLRRPGTRTEGVGLSHGYRAKKSKRWAEAYFITPHNQLRRLTQKPGTRSKGVGSERISSEEIVQLGTRFREVGLRSREAGRRKRAISGWKLVKFPQ